MNRRYAFALALLCHSLLGKSPAKPPEIVALASSRGNFHPVFRVGAIPPDLLGKINKTTWHTGCPVPVSDLRVLTVSYWSFKGIPETGTLLVNEAVAKDLRKIFRRLFHHGFMIERMEPIESFGGDDNRSMEANNTSSFNCRDITGRPGKFSNHSWGRAIDINPLTNPYIKGSTILPPEGRNYLDRNRAYVGGILSDSYLVRSFRKKGWTWGGSWTDRKDYQHFEKPERHP